MNMSAQEFDTTFQEEWQNMPPVFEKGYPSYEAVNRKPIVETEYDGMETPFGPSEPMTDLDYESERP